MDVITIPGGGVCMTPPGEMGRAIQRDAGCCGNSMALLTAAPGTGEPCAEPQRCGVHGG